MTCSDLCSAPETAERERTTEGVAKGTFRRALDRSIHNDGRNPSQACPAAEQLAFRCNEALTLGPSTRPLAPPHFADIPSADNPDHLSGAGYLIGGLAAETGL